MTTTTLAPTAPTGLARRAGPLLVAGGLLWIGTFGCLIVNGFLTGTLPSQPDAVSPLFLRIAIRLFALSVIVLGLGFWGFAPRVRSRGLRIAALVVTSIAMAMAAVNNVTLSGLLGTPSYSDTLGGLSVMISSLGALLLGIAAARTPGLGRRIPALMIAIGLSTIPVLIFTPLPIGPDWATDFLAFLTSGAAFVALGASLWRERSSDA